MINRKNENFFIPIDFKVDLESTYFKMKGIKNCFD